MCTTDICAIGLNYVTFKCHLNLSKGKSNYLYDAIMLPTTGLPREFRGPEAEEKKYEAPCEQKNSGSRDQLWEITAGLHY